MTLSGDSAGLKLNSEYNLQQPSNRIVLKKVRILFGIKRKISIVREAPIGLNFTFRASGRAQ